MNIVWILHGLCKHKTHVFCKRWWLSGGYIPEFREGRGGVLRKVDIFLLAVGKKKFALTHYTQHRRQMLHFLPVLTLSTLCWLVLTEP